MKDFSAITGVLLAIIGVAVLAVIVSKNSQTSNVLTAGGSAFGNMIRCALSPITGVACASSSTSGSGLIPRITSGITYGGITN